MGYIKHDAIVVTGFDSNLEVARKAAITRYLQVTDIVESNLNGYASFLIVPDGSKEGWDDSDKGDQARDSWKKYVKEHYPYLNWVHVSYGGDEPEINTAVIEHHKSDGVL